MMPWLAIITLGAILAVWGKHPARLPVHWAAKPLTMALILAATVVHSSRLDGFGRAALLVALACSLAGDVALMLPQGLAPGLASFLLAHVAYLVAFGTELPWRAHQLGWLAPVFGASVALVVQLWPHFGRLRPAVIVYVAALTLVAWRLLARHELIPSVGAGSWMLGAVGALLFLAGDGMLAARRFGGHEPPYALELGAYFAAQLAITASTWS
jgi:alkylglycerol monooxygenase